MLLGWWEKLVSVGLAGFRNWNRKDGRELGLCCRWNGVRCRGLCGAVEDGQGTARPLPGELVASSDFL